MKGLGKFPEETGRQRRLPPFDVRFTIGKRSYLLTR